MHIEKISPFVRFADEVKYTIFRGRVKTPDCRLLYILGGEGTIALENTVYAIISGLLILFQPGTLYEIKPAPYFNAIAVDFDYTQEYSKSTGVFPPVRSEEFDRASAHKKVTFENCDAFNTPLVLNNIFQIKPALEELMTEFKYKKVFYKEKSSVMLKSILLDIARLTLATDKKSVLAKRILDYISENYFKDIKNKKIAHDLNYDPCYLNRIMISQTGISLHKYVMKYRVNTAVRLLLTTNLTIEEIAKKTGFDSQSHFSSCCKAVTGVTPSFYKR